MMPQVHIEQALHALRSARILSVANEYDGACNRAYYAAFHAAHAALVWCGAIPEDSGVIKSHAGLISQFSKNLVLTGVFTSDVARRIATIKSSRSDADYFGGVKEEEVVAQAVESATLFVMEVIGKFNPEMTLPEWYLGDPFSIKDQPNNRSELDYYIDLKE